VREGNADVLYVVVNRTLRGQSIKTIERMHDRQFVYGAEDAFCVDCGLESSLPTPSANLSANASTGSTTFTADSPVFSSGDVGKVLRMQGGIATITAYVSNQIIVGTWTRTPNEIIPDDPNNTPVPANQGDWSLTQPSSVFFGLDHLEGQTVAILADG